MKAIRTTASNVLIDVLPLNHAEHGDTRAYEFRYVGIVTTHRRTPWIGKEKNVNFWVELANGYAVGWNENPSRGFSFPVVKMKVAQRTAPTLTDELVEALESLLSIIPEMHGTTRRAEEHNAKIAAAKAAIAKAKAVR